MPTQQFMQDDAVPKTPPQGKGKDAIRGLRPNY
jgi:hypothetical protein